jgi:nucleotide-binding universal stress UspA family protein
MPRETESRELPNEIVVATDFSPSSVAALHVAARLAQAVNARVTVLHVFEYIRRQAYKVPVDCMVDEIRKDVMNKLVEIERTLQESGVDAAIMIRDGLPTEEIPLFLKVFSKPLLLVGTHAVAGVERCLLGSTAEEVLRKVSCPVITVGPPAWSRAALDQHFRKILFATNFSAASLGAIPLIAALCLATSGTLRVAHVATDSTSDAEVSMLFEPIIETIRQRSIGNAKIELECAVLHGSSVSKALICDAKRSEADLLVLGVKRSSSIAAHLSPKVAFQTIAAASCPVLTISS